MLQWLKTFFSSRAVFYSWVLQERQSAVWFIILLIAIIIILFVTYKILKAKEKLTSGNVLALLTIMISAVIALTIALGSVVDDVTSNTYEKAESLYSNGFCQDAKQLYWKIYKTDYRDCREKMALCDYRSARYYISKKEYDNAFALLLPHLFNNPTATSAEILDDMRDLVVSTEYDIIQGNEVNGMLINAAWMLGRWEDNAGNYIRFTMHGDTFHASGNIYDRDPDKAFTCFFRYGLYKLLKTETQAVTVEIIFYPTSKDEAYAYNVSSGKMFFLVRDTAEE